MKIERMKICGLKEPVGFLYDIPDVSWNVTGAKGKKSVETKVAVSTEENFKNIIFEKQDEELPCQGTALDISLQPYTRYFVQVTVTTELGECAEGRTFFETGKMKENWKAEWIGIRQDERFHPVFRKEIYPGETPDSARLYICGLGLFEAYLNGERVTEEVLMPFVNDYRSTMQIITFDVSSQVCKGRNILDVFLGNGWYKGRFGQDQQFHYGKDFSLIAELHLIYRDGTKEIIGTDETWQYRGSDIEDSGIYDGETFNRLLWKNRENKWRNAVRLDMSKEHLTDRYSVPLKVMEELPVKEIITTPAGEYVLDLGQNFAGWIRFRNRTPEGTRVRLEFGEVLQEGCFYNENYRTAVNGFTYISDGKEEWICPHFTYFGFRYVRVSGWPGRPDAGDFIGCAVYSDLEQTGYLATDHEKLNQLISNVLWGQKSNFVDIPTDCPQRDERLGWTADAQIFAATATYNMDTRAFYRKYMRDIRDAQLRHGGGVPAFVPEGGGGMCPVCAVWGDVAVLIPDVLKRFYNNHEETALYYPIMKEWIEYVAAAVERHHGKRGGLWDFDFQFGDWLALDGPDEQSMKGGTSDTYVATVYYYQTASIMAKTAEYLGNSRDAENYRKLAEEIRETLLHEYFSPAGHLTENTQTAYILALRFGLYRNKEVLIKDLLAILKKSKFKIKCGFTGAPVLCQTLSEHGESALAWQFLMNEEAPGWLHEVNLGATTIWERWNSLLPDGKISGTDMNSLNHYSYGSVVEFLYAYAAGIRSGAEGFSNTLIAPQPNGRIKNFTCSYQSPVGKFVSNWRILDNGELYIHIEIPFGCKARIVLPQSNKEPVTAESGSYDFQYKPLHDYRCLYTEDSLMSDVFANKQARELLLSNIPQAASFMGDDARQVKDLMELAFLGADPKTIQHVIEELISLKC